jgi:hypothetical protein
MKKELETNVNIEERKERRKLDSYEEYKQHGNQGTRRIAKENSFKTKIKIIINQSKKENKWLFHSLNIMFGACHVKAHEKWLIRNMENDSNIYRTYNNIQKSVERGLIEILPIKDKINKYLTLEINKNGSEDKRKWKLVFKIQYKEVLIMTDVSYNKMANCLNENEELKETDFSGSTVQLGEKELGKEQYFSKTLRESFEYLDNMAMKLIRYKTSNLQGDEDNEVR